MANKIRSYELKRLDNANVQRSLQGAVKRSNNGRLLLCFCTKSAVLPDEYEQHKIPDGGAYLEVYSNGEFTDDYLHIIIGGIDHEIEECFESDAKIKLCEIDGPIGIDYEDALSSDQIGRAHV